MDDMYRQLYLYLRNDGLDHLICAAPYHLTNAIPIQCLQEMDKRITLGVDPGWECKHKQCSQGLDEEQLMGSCFCHRDQQRSIIVDNLNVIKTIS